MTDSHQDMPRHVYLLCCPRSGAAKYVGVTKYPKERLRGHVAAAERGYHSNDELASWIVSVGRPSMRVIFSGSTTDAHAIERLLIAHTEDIGLLNKTWAYVVTKEEKISRSHALRGRFKDLQ